MRNCVAILVFFALLVLGCSAPKKEKPVVSLSTESMSSTTDGISVVSIQVQPTAKDVSKKFQQFGEPIEQQELQNAEI